MVGQVQNKLVAHNKEEIIGSPKRRTNVVTRASKQKKMNNEKTLLCEQQIRILKVAKKTNNHQEKKIGQEPRKIKSIKSSTAGTKNSETFLKRSTDHDLQHQLQLNVSEKASGKEDDCLKDNLELGDDQVDQNGSWKMKSPQSQTASDLQSICKDYDSFSAGQQRLIHANAYPAYSGMPDVQPLTPYYSKDDVTALSQFQFITPNRVDFISGQQQLAVPQLTSSYHQQKNSGLHNRAIILPQPLSNYTFPCTTPNNAAFSTAQPQLIGSSVQPQYNLYQSAPFTAGRVGGVNGSMESQRFFSQKKMNLECRTSSNAATGNEQHQLAGKSVQRLKYQSMPFSFSYCEGDNHPAVPPLMCSTQQINSINMSRPLDYNPAQCIDNNSNGHQQNRYGDFVPVDFAPQQLPYFQTGQSDLQSWVASQPNFQTQYFIQQKAVPTASQSSIYVGAVGQPQWQPMPCSSNHSDLLALCEKQQRALAILRKQNKQKSAVIKEMNRLGAPYHLVTSRVYNRRF